MIFEQKKKWRNFYLKISIHSRQDAKEYLKALEQIKKDTTMSIIAQKALLKKELSED